MHFAKALYPIDVTLFGMVIDDSPVHPSKTAQSIEVMLLGIVIVVRLVQLWNKLVFRVVTLFGIVIDVKPLHSANVLTVDNQLVTH